MFPLVTVFSSKAADVVAIVLLAPVITVEPVFNWSILLSEPTNIA